MKQAGLRFWRFGLQKIAAQPLFLNGNAMNTPARLRLPSLVRATILAACAASPLANAGNKAPPAGAQDTVYEVKIFFPSNFGHSPGVMAFNNRGQFVGTRIDFDPRFSRTAIWDGRDATEWTTFGDAGTIPAGINDAGTIAGKALQFLDQRTSWRAVIWRGTSMTFLRTLGGDYGEATSINNAGQIAGYTSTGRENHATLWKGNQVIDLGTLGGTLSVANSINDAGDVVGYSTAAADATIYATLWEHGKSKIQKLGTLGGYRSEAVAANKKGQVVGWSVAGDGTTHAVLWEHGKTTDLGTLGGNQSTASAIDDSGTIFGFSLNAQNQARGTLWRGSRIIDVNTLLDPKATGITITNVVGVNDVGELRAFGRTPSGSGNMLLTPQRRPSSH
jgi:probable HAF family extracellular repeat protein